MTRLNSRRRSGFSLIELLAVIFIVVVLGAFLLIIIPEMVDPNRSVKEKIKCGSNLKQFGLALMMYANENHGHYPKVRYLSGTKVTPVFGTGIAATQPFQDDGPQPNDVTAAIFLLMRTQDIGSEVFICPSSAQKKDDFGGGANSALSHSNFSNLKKNLSYSMNNPYLNAGVVTDEERWWSNKMSAEFALAADKNPGTKGKDDNVLKPNAESIASEMKFANSNNHEKEGQNVLYADGHVEWQQSPFVGINKDNIYTTKAGQVEASPVDTEDSVLLPTDD